MCERERQTERWGKHMRILQKGQYKMYFLKHRKHFYGKKNVYITIKTNLKEETKKVQLIKAQFKMAISFKSFELPGQKHIKATLPSQNTANRKLRANLITAGDAMI
jgi:hypothetical protein